MMYTLQKLLGFDAPEHTALQAAQVSFRGWFSPWLALALLAAGTGAIFVLYFRERAHIQVRRRVVLALLRAALIGLVLFLLLRPVLVAEFAGWRPRPVVFLLDNSQSMQQQDRRLLVPDLLRAAIAKSLVPPDISVEDTSRLLNLPTDQLQTPKRAELVRAVIGNLDLRLDEGLRRAGPVQHYTFGQRLRSPPEETPGPQALLAGFDAGETQTALADSVYELLVRGGDLPAAIFLVTDGRDNASKRTLFDVADECKLSQVPLFIYGVGTSESASLQIKDVLVPNIVFAEDQVSVSVRGTCRGFKRGKIVLQLSLGDLRLPPVEFDNTDSGDFRRTITLVPPKGPEKRELVVTAALKEHDSIKDGIRRPVRVVENKVKVLYIENTPRWEFKFLQPALLRDRRVDARFVLVEGDPDVLKSGSPFLERFPEKFPQRDAKDPDQRPYDLLIIGDVPARFWGKQGTSAVEKFVREGGGLVGIAGPRYLPADYLRSEETSASLLSLFPVEFHPVARNADRAQRSQPFQPMLTNDGEHSEWANMLVFADTEEENRRVWRQDLWKDIRGFYWQYPAARLRSGARALLVNPEVKISTKQGEQSMPLLSAQRFGKGQVLFLATDETWRWRFNAQNRYFARFWGQVVYQMGLPHLQGNSERVQLAINRSEAISGRSSYVYARILDANQDPLEVAQVLGTLEFREKGTQATRPVDFKPVAGQDGEYQALLAHGEPGAYELKELRLENGERLPPANLQYNVDLPPHHERELAGMAEDELRRAAQMSGGRFYREEDLHHLADDLKPAEVHFVQRQEAILWTPLAWLLFVALITAEWILRKLSNLS